MSLFFFFLVVEEIDVKDGDYECGGEVNGDDCVCYVEGGFLVYVGGVVLGVGLVDVVCVVD